MNDEAICDKIVNKGPRDACIVSIAEALLDWEYCLNISSSIPTLEQECLTFVAGKTGSTEPCTHVPAQALKGQCYGMAGLTSANFSVCNSVPLKQVVDMNDAHFARDTCWNYVATTGNGLDLCANIYNSDLRASCQG